MSGEAVAYQRALRNAPCRLPRDHRPDANNAILRRTIPSGPAKMPTVEGAALSSPIIEIT